MNMISPLKTEIDFDEIKKLFSKFREIYGHSWMSLCSTPEEWKSLMQVWFIKLKQFSSYVLSQSLNQSSYMYRSHAPNVNQVYVLCLKFSGIPEVKEIIDYSNKGEFIHPVIKIIYDKIGSWDFKNLTEKELEKKIISFLPDAISNFQSEPESCWKRLNHFCQTQEKISQDKPNSIKETSQRIGEYYLDEIRSKLGQNQKYLTEEEKQNVRDILKTSKSYPESTNVQDHINLYDRVRSERQEEGRAIYNDLKLRHAESTADKPKSYADNVYKFNK